MAFVALALSLMTYFNGYMNFSLTKSATTLTNFMGTTFLLTLVGGFVSDTYLSRFKTCVVFACFELLVSASFQYRAHCQSILMCIVLFWAFSFVFSLNFLKFVCYREVSTSLYINIYGVLFSFPTDVGSHISLPFMAQCSHCHSFPSSIDVRPPNPPLRGLVSLLAHRLVSTLLRAQPPRQYIARCLALIPLVMAQTHADIILFGLFILELCF